MRKAARMAQRLGAPIIGLVENMSYATCPRCGERIEVFGPSQAMHTALRSGVPFLGRLPLDSELTRHCDTGGIEAYAAEAFAPLAEQIMEQISATETVPLFKERVRE